jgi:hypothetical protein
MIAFEEYIFEHMVDFGFGINTQRFFDPLRFVVVL